VSKPSWLPSVVSVVELSRFRGHRAALAMLKISGWPQPCGRRDSKGIAQPLPLALDEVDAKARRGVAIQRASRSPYYQLRVARGSVGCRQSRFRGHRAALATKHLSHAVMIAKQPSRLRASRSATLHAPRSTRNTQERPNQTHRRRDSKGHRAALGVGPVTVASRFKGHRAAFATRAKLVIAVHFRVVAIQRASRSPCHGRLKTIDS
jgi:hypothetical protein